MYVLIKARHRNNRRSGRFVEIDLANQPVTTLKTVYGEVQLFITYPGLSEPKLLHFDKVTNIVQNLDPSTTVQQWLTAIGNYTLPFEDGLPIENERLVHYAQAWHSGYKIEAKGRYTNVQSYVNPLVMEDLIVTHPKHAFKTIDDYCLFSVNGFIHLSDYGTDGVRIVDGNSTVVKSNDNQVGVLSFKEVGKIQKLPIDLSWVKKQKSDSTYYKGVYVTFPKTIDLENKTVLLVLGGYLQTLGKTYHRVGLRTWRIEIGNILFKERYFESLRGMKLNISLSHDENNPSLFATEELVKDSTVLEYLSLSQTFFVLVDCKTMFHELVGLEYLKFPGRYVNTNGKHYPVVGAYGRLLDYHCISEHGYQVYCASNNWRYNYTANTTDWTVQDLVNEGKYPEYSKEHSPAYLRLLGTNN